MPTRTADAEWQGNLQQGRGTMRVGSGAFEGSYSFKSRMGDETVGTNPEELIGAAHAGCYSMALSSALAGLASRQRACIQPRASTSIKCPAALPSTLSTWRTKPLCQA